MIPLSQWLLQRTGPDVPTEWAQCSDAPEDATSTVGEDLQQPSDETPNRTDELLTAREEAEERIRELRLAHGEREQLLIKRLGEDACERITSEISRAFGVILEQLEESICLALGPFLEDQARLKATSDLIALIRRDLQDADSTVIEIKAPPELHDALSGLAGRSNLSLGFAKSPIVEVSTADRRMRFEELSAHWCRAIAGGDP